MRSMNNGNGQSNWQGPQAGPQQGWETALARATVTTFWELV
jgi:hypothetical protein